MPKKKTSHEGSLESKADFIRSKPDATAPELVALGKTLGIVISESRVYNVRAADRKRASPVQLTQVPKPVSSALETQLRSIVLRLGLDRSEEVFSNLKSSANLIESTVVPNTRWKPNGIVPTN